MTLFRTNKYPSNGITPPTEFLRNPEKK